MLSSPGTIKNPVNFSSQSIQENDQKQTRPRKLHDPKFSPPSPPSKHSDGIVSIDVLGLTESLSLSPKDIDFRRKIIVRIQKILSTEYPDREIKAHLFGSSENGLGIYNSDLDITLLSNWPDFNVKKLASLLKKHGFEIIDCVSEAKVPIVKARELFSNLLCDFNINNPLALENTRLLRTYANLDPRVMPLIICIKFWAKQRVLNDAAAGGTFSTYTWVIIVINFLQTRNPPILPVLQLIKVVPNPCEGVDAAFFDNVELLQTFGRANKETLGGLLFNFFVRFGYEFNYKEDVISIRTGTILKKISKKWTTGPGNHFFCIEEPFNTDRDLGNSADKASVEGLRGEFRRAAHILSNSPNLGLVCYPYYVEKDRICHTYSKNIADSEVRALKNRLARLDMSQNKPSLPISGFEPSKQPIPHVRLPVGNPAFVSSRHPTVKHHKPKPKAHQLSDLLPPYKTNTNFVS